MLSTEDFMTIQALVKRGVYQKDIAEELGVHPRTVRRALRRGGASAKRPSKRASKLDPRLGHSFAVVPGDHVPSADRDG